MNVSEALTLWTKKDKEMNKSINESQLDFIEHIIIKQKIFND